MTRSHQRPNKNLFFCVFIRCALRCCCCYSVQFECNGRFLVVVVVVVVLHVHHFTQLLLLLAGLSVVRSQNIAPVPVSFYSNFYLFAFCNPAIDLCSSCDDDDDFDYEICKQIWKEKINYRDGEVLCVFSLKIKTTFCGRIET